METPHPLPDPQPPDPLRPLDAETHPRDLFWVLAGGHGLRSGWAVLLFVALFYTITFVLDTIAVTADPALAENALAPSTLLIGELLPVLAILCAGVFVAKIQQKSPLDYNLRGPARAAGFCAGLAAGFAALSVLVGAEALGGWLRFGPVALHGAGVARYAAIWGVDFLLVACFEEGSFRCFILATVERGMRFGWALATVAVTCAIVALHSHANGAGGVYTAAALGLVPCLLLDRVRMPGSGFWQAAWATSTAFGAYHTANQGETAIGIFTASAIGFVFCVSVRITGSAWWALGCHAAWDWAETYFYGTANSGLAPQGHLLTTLARGNALWSGGNAGPEGSLLAVPVTALMLGFLLLVNRRSAATSEALAAESIAR
jgi:membrane protease YdiL (CAAX protease family)